MRNTRLSAAPTSASVRRAGTWKMRVRRISPTAANPAALVRRESSTERMADTRARYSSCTLSSHRPMAVVPRTTRSALDGVPVGPADDEQRQDPGGDEGQSVDADQDLAQVALAPGRGDQGDLVLRVDGGSWPAMPSEHLARAWTRGSRPLASAPWGGSVRSTWLTLVLPAVLRSGLAQAWLRSTRRLVTACATLPSASPGGQGEGVTDGGQQAFPPGWGLAVVTCPLAARPPPRPRPRRPHRPGSGPRRPRDRRRGRTAGGRRSGC